MKTGTRISDWARLRQQEIITGIARGGGDGTGGGPDLYFRVWSSGELEDERL